MTKHFADIDELQDFVLATLKEKMESDVHYLAEMAKECLPDSVTLVDVENDSETGEQCLIIEVEPNTQAENAEPKMTAAQIRSEIGITLSDVPTSKAG